MQCQMTHRLTGLLLMNNGNKWRKRIKRKKEGDTKIYPIVIMRSRRAECGGGVQCPPLILALSLVQCVVSAGLIAWLMAPKHLPPPSVKQQQQHSNSDFFSRAFDLIAESVQQLIVSEQVEKAIEMLN